MCIGLVVLMALPGLAQNAKKILVDLTGDGRAEVAVEGPPGGNSGSWFLKIISGRDGKVLLKVGISGSTADGYCLSGKRIAVWTGDWKATASKWEPHYYDLNWYEWSRKSKKFVIVREGFTKKAYSNQEAVKAMSKIAVIPGKALVLSTQATFALDARYLVVRKIKSGEKIGWTVEKEDAYSPGEKWGPNVGRWFYVEIRRKKEVPVAKDRSDDPNRLAVADVIFRRDGQHKIVVQAVNHG